MKLVSLFAALLMLVGCGGGASDDPPQTSRNAQEFSYGADPKQRLDVYLPQNPQNAPMIVMLHGGSWQFGDKRSPGVADAKVDYWLPRGYIFVSVNTRLLPDLDPLGQTRDLAAAMGFVQANAAQWGGDAGRMVLMGHSSGAHVAALLATRNDLQTAAGLRPWSGTVTLDTEVYDVADVMRNNPLRPYRTAFGADPAYWAAVSPQLYLDAGDRPFLMVCAAQARIASPCVRSQTFAAVAAQNGIAAQVLPQNLSHRDINVTLGAPSAYTQTVADWIASVL